MRRVNLVTCRSRPLHEQSRRHNARFSRTRRRLCGPPLATVSRSSRATESLSNSQRDPSKPHNNPFNPASTWLARVHLCLPPLRSAKRRPRPFDVLLFARQIFCRLLSARHGEPTIEAQGSDAWDRVDAILGFVKIMYDCFKNEVTLGAKCKWPLYSTFCNKERRLLCARQDMRTHFLTFSNLNLNSYRRSSFFFLLLCLKNK